MKDLISSLKTRLGTIDGVQQVFMYRDSNPSKYPAIACIWENTDNTFETNLENKKVVTFRIYIMVNVAGKTMQEVDETILPNVYDKVSDYFDENWNFGTSVEGHRVWSTLSMADSRISVEDKSKIAYMDCRLQIKYVKDN
jgi:hypothetical protein